LAALDSISQRLGQVFTQLQLHFFGAFALPANSSVRCELIGVTDPTQANNGGLSLLIDGSPVQLQQEGQILVAKVNLSAGLHRFSWQQTVAFQAGARVAAIQLILRDESTRQIIPLGHDGQTQQYGEQWPTALRVNLRG
jgi:hypothetical protein